MKLFLTSVAAVTLEKIIPMLPKAPQKLKVAFVPTAADPYEDKWFVKKDKEKLRELGFNIVVLDLKEKNEENIRQALLSIDIIFVAGGNTFYLLEQTQKSGFDVVVKELIKKGIIYIGSSAGSIIVGPDIAPVKAFDEADKAQLASTKGLGLIDFVVLPHYGKEEYQFLYDGIMREYKDRYTLIPLTDNQMVVVENGNYQVVEA